MANKNEAEGVGKQIKGKAKEVAGKLTGNSRLEAEGKVEKNSGKAQESVGKVQKATTTKK